MTVTRSEKFTAMWRVSPIPYVPVRFGDETDSTLGRMPSTARLDDPASEPSPPGPGSARIAALPVASAIEEPAGTERADLLA